MQANFNLPHLIIVDSLGQAISWSTAEVAFLVKQNKEIAWRGEAAFEKLSIGERMELCYF
ncbi:MAG: hypothetical protein JRD88_10125 [Deltaproteobacteria bacterium]|jgi:hypothetical protein|nr:hypothetical protein [Deltaproteobacteria bacterium]